MEEYVATAARNQTHQSGKYRALVQALSTPVADLHLSTRAASALQRRNIRYVYELVQKSPTDLFALPNFGKKSLKKIEEKLATFGLTLGMPVEDDTYRRTIVATVAANLHPTKG